MLARMVPRILILHGWYGSQEPHWQRWLASRLRDTGAAHVQLPDLPNAAAPLLDSWRTALDAELTVLAAQPGERIVVCHSLGCILWLHHAASRRAGSPRVDRVVLNAPPAPVPELPTFFPAPIDPVGIAAAAKSTRIVWSDDDPYCAEGAGGLYAEPLGIPNDRLAGQGHLNVDAGYGPWPAMLDWCLGRRTNLAPRG